MFGYKFLILTAITIIIGNFLAMYSKVFTIEILFPSANLILSGSLFTIAIALFLTFFGLLLIVHQSRNEIILFYSFIIGTLAINLFIIYQSSGSLELILNGLMLILSLISIQIRFNRMLSNQIKVKLSEIAANTGVFMLFISISISMNFFILNSQDTQGTNTFEKTKSYILNTSGAFIDKTVDRDLLKNNFPQIEIDNLLPEQEQQVKDEVKNQVVQRIDQIIDPYEPYFVPIATGLIFLTLISLIPIVRIITWIISMIIFAIFKSLNIINEEAETVEVIRYRL